MDVVREEVTEIRKEVRHEAVKDHRDHLSYFQFYCFGHTNWIPGAIVFFLAMAGALASVIVQGVVHSDPHPAVFVHTCPVQQFGPDEGNTLGSIVTGTITQAPGDNKSPGVIGYDIYLLLRSPAHEYRWTYNETARFAISPGIGERENYGASIIDKITCIDVCRVFQTPEAPYLDLPCTDPNASSYYVSTNATNCITLGSVAGATQCLGSNADPNHYSYAHPVGAQMSDWFKWTRTRGYVWKVRNSTECNPSTTNNPVDGFGKRNPECSVTYPIPNEGLPWFDPNPSLISGAVLLHLDQTAYPGAGPSIFPLLGTLRPITPYFPFSGPQFV